tara:strand:+ start:630 stop:815 length:186 start_codon:yes stop_codon:yes gene_type:complete
MPKGIGYNGQKKLKDAKGKPPEDGPCGRDMQGTKLVMYKGQCMHPNEVKRLKSRDSLSIPR